MAIKKRKCPACGEKKEFRTDVKTCGCQGTRGISQALKETNEVSGDKWAITLPKTRIHTLDQLLEYFEVDLSIWEVERFVCNKWEMGYKLNEQVGTEELYQVKAWMKRRRNIEDAKMEIKNLLEISKIKFPEPRAIKKPNVKGGMLEINLTDHHFGKLSWSTETLGANYDVKIATQVFHRAVDALLSRAPFESYEEIWFVVGNDLFNSDDTQGRTTSGTQVESDARHEKTYTTVRTLMVEAIEQLRKRAGKVKVIIVPGNHDHNATWHLGDSLELYFSKYPDVSVDNTPSPRKYHVYGQTLIGYAHGHQGKKADLPLLMATECRELFGQTKFHEWHTSHTHQTRTEEKHGIRVRTLPALCPPDAWHSENGYVGNLRSSEAYVWDRTEGLISIVIYTDSDDFID